MNHARADRSNVNTFIALSKGGPMILMLARRKIEIGEELVFNYNSAFSLYNTKNYK